MQLSRWVSVACSESMVILFHEGSGQMLVFRPEAAQSIKRLQNANDTKDFIPADVDQELVACLSRYEFLE